MVKLGCFQILNKSVYCQSFSFATSLKYLQMLCLQFGQLSVEVTELFRRGDSVLKSSLFVRYEDHIGILKTFSAAFEDMVAAGGFEFAAKNAR